jgi:hypothetical protein
MRPSHGEVTIVIASPRGGTLLSECLESVLPQAAEMRAGVIVSGRGELGGDLVRGKVGVVAVASGSGASLPVLRGAGLASVGTPWAALIEDHCIAAPGWLPALCDAAADSDVVGGRMSNAQRARMVDCGAYFAEYGFFTGVGVAGPPAVTAANVLYGPAALPLAAQLFTSGLWEDVVHARLRRAGCRFAGTPAAEMQQNDRYSMAAFCADRYRHGLEYARVRLREEPHRARWIRALASPLLPLLLAWRVGRNTRPEDRAAFVRALPATLLFLSAWSGGEMSGYLRGRAS